MKKALAALALVGLLAVFFTGCIGDNQDPEAKFSVTPSGIVNTGQYVIFSGNDSKDPDGSIDTYSWDLGDGTMSNSSWVAHTYVTYGVKTVTLTVKDNKGAQKSTTQTISVNAAPDVQVIITPAKTPWQNFTGNAYPAASLITFNAGNTNDPDSANLTYAWNFGDSETSSNKISTHNYTVGGNYTVTLAVSDGYATVNWATTITIQDLSFWQTNFSWYTNVDGYRFVNFSAYVKNMGASEKIAGSVTLYVESFGASGPIANGNKALNNSFVIHETSISLQQMSLIDIPISLNADTNVRAQLYWNGIFMCEVTELVPV